MNGLYSYWSKYPPTHVLVAAYLLKGSERAEANPETLMAGMSAAVHSMGGSNRGKLPDHYRTRLVDPPPV